MGCYDLISHTGPMGDDVETGHSCERDIRCGPGMEGRGRQDAHCIHPGDTLKMHCFPFPPAQEPCSISFSCLVASLESRGQYVLIASATNKINLLCNSECVLSFLCMRLLFCTIHITSGEVGWKSGILISEKERGKLLFTF